MKSLIQYRDSDNLLFFFIRFKQAVRSLRVTLEVLCSFLPQYMVNRLTRRAEPQNKKIGYMRMVIILMDFYLMYSTSIRIFPFSCVVQYMFGFLLFEVQRIRYSLIPSVLRVDTLRIGSSDSVYSK